MKLFYVILFACMPVTILAQQSELADLTTPNYEHAEMVRESQFTTLPSFIRFKKDHPINVSNIQSWMTDNMKFDSEIGFELIREETDNLGHIHYRYQQTYKGLPIEDAIWIVHTKAGFVYALNGMIYSEIASSTSATLTESASLEKALQHVNANTYKWEIPGEETHLKWESNNPNATYFPTGKQVFIAADRNYHAQSFRLAYKFNIYAHAPLYRAELYVDANSGEIIRENEIIHHVDEPGTAHTAYSGEKDIIADSFGAEYRLRDGSRGDGVRTFDLNEGTSFGSAIDFVDDDNDWDNVNPQLDEYATDAHWGAERTYDYFFEEHGRNSLDNAGFQLNSYVHYGVDFYNAFWDGSRMTYGDGNGAGVTPLTTLDIAGHEVTHGLTNFTANLIYEAESGALNESFSDIFGTAIEAFSRPDDWDWLIGAEIGEGGFRSMSNPNAYSHPDTYFGDFWAPLDGWDSGGVHTNSGVQNFWYYLLTEGGAGTNDNGDAYTVLGLGMEAASAVAFRNLTVYLTPGSPFEDARFYAIQAAIDLYGGCTNEVEQVTNAWYAVGVGPEYVEEVVADFEPSETTACEAPFTVTFSNVSVNGIDYVWNFGDGGSSTDLSPTHTYTTPGTYTVTLSVDGGDCGTDEIVYTNLIEIDTDLDCPVLLPTSGTGTTQTSCEGTLFDSGGSTENYGPSENAQITISPTDAETVAINFSDFDVEPGGVTCVYDYVEVYDGPDDGADLIGKYCNVSPPPAEITSTGPSITIVFHSDGIVQHGGFRVDWTCTEIVDDSGIGENELGKNIQIYPNPTNGMLTLDTKTLNSGTIEITDLLGKKTFVIPFNATLTQIDLSNYHAKGIYMVRIRDENGQLHKTEKVILD